MPGAYKRSLAEHRKDGALPQMFWMHQMDQVPGMWLEMEEDKKGLYVKGTLADTALGNEMHTLLGMKECAASRSATRLGTPITTTTAIAC